MIINLTRTSEPREETPLFGLCFLSVILMLPAGAASASSIESNQKTEEVIVPVKYRALESQRSEGSLMTWIVQKTTYEDNLVTLRLAGVQFEDAFGLSVVMLDELASFDEGAELRLKLNGPWIPMSDLKQNPKAQSSAPLCQNSEKRAIVFLRAAQLQRQLGISHANAGKWSRYGRAACVGWAGSFITKQD